MHTYMCIHTHIHTHKYFRPSFYPLIILLSSILSPILYSFPYSSLSPSPPSFFPIPVHLSSQSFPWWTERRLYPLTIRYVTCPIPHKRTRGIYPGRRGDVVMSLRQRQRSPGRSRRRQNPDHVGLSLGRVRHGVPDVIIEN